MAIAHHYYNNRFKWHSVLEEIRRYILEDQVESITNSQVEFIKLFAICKTTNPENECEISNGELWLTSEIRKYIDSSHRIFYNLYKIYSRFSSACLQGRISDRY